MNAQSFVIFRVLTVLFVGITLPMAPSALPEPSQAKRAATSPAAAPRTTPSPSETEPRPQDVTGSATGAGLGVSMNGGLWIGKSQAEIDAQVDRIAALGVGWIRVDIPWFEVERVRGTRHWYAMDRMVNSANRAGLKVVAILTTVPAWSRDGGTWRTGMSTDEQQWHFIEYAKEAATRYAGKVTAFEVWNEPNLKAFWEPGPDPHRYASLLKQVVPVIRAAAPDAVIVSGSPGGIAPGSSDIDPREWYRIMYRLGAAQMVDALGLHPYPNAWAPTPKAYSGEMMHSFAIQEIAKSYGEPDKPLWGTETGVPTAGEASYSEETQAAMVAQLHGHWTRLRAPGPLIFYTLTDPELEGREGHFGLYRRDGSAKPAADALRRLATS